MIGIHKISLPVLSTVVAMIVVVSGCAGSGAVDSSPEVQESGMSTAELDSLYWQRQADARTRFTQPDVDFMTGMIGHHAQALVMSALAPTNGASPQLLVLAARITNAQNDEIATMQKWLRDRGQPVPEVHIDGSKLMIHGAGDHDMHMNMPGMLSPEQMTELENARGNEFDRLFLTYMIQHHKGAITMVQDLYGSGGAGQDEASFKIASDIDADQQTEIARMKLMLESLEGSGSDE